MKIRRVVGWSLVVRSGVGTGCHCMDGQHVVGAFLFDVGQKFVDLKLKSQMELGVFWVDGGTCVEKMILLVA